MNYLFLNPWLAFLLAIFLLPPVLIMGLRFVVAPLLIKKKQTLRMNRSWLPTRDEQLSSELRTFIASTTLQLKSLGFAFRCNVASAQQAVPGLDSIQVFLVHPERGDIAHMIAVMGNASRTLSLSFRTQLPDGRVVLTTQSKTPTIYPPLENLMSIVASWMDDPRILYEFHRRRLTSLGVSDMRGQAPADGEEMQYFEMNERQVEEMLQRRGYHYADPSAGVWRLTYKGAFLVTWRLVEPLKSYRLRRRRRKAMREWRRLHMDDFRPAAQTYAVENLPVDSCSDLSQPQIIPATTPSPPPLTYSTLLDNGRIELLQSGDETVVRVTSGSFSSFVVDKMLVLLLDGALLFGLVLVGFTVVAQHLAGSALVQGNLSRWAVIGFPLVLMISAISRIREWRQWRRGYWVRASDRGIEIGDPSVPARTEYVARGQIDSLWVGLWRWNIYGITYQLRINRAESAPAIALLTSRDKETLKFVSQQFQRVLGITPVTNSSSLPR